MADFSTVQRVIINGSDVDAISSGGTTRWAIATGNPWAFPSGKVWGKYNGNYVYISSSKWYYDSDDSLADPCPGDWTTNVPALQCTRTVDTSYTGTSYTYFQNSYGGPGGPYWWSNGDCSHCVSGYASAGHCHRGGSCPNPPGGNASWFKSNCWANTAGWGYYNRYNQCGLQTGYNCPTGGSLSGSTCVQVSTQNNPFSTF